MAEGKMAFLKRRRRRRPVRVLFLATTLLSSGGTVLFFNWGSTLGIPRPAYEFFSAPDATSNLLLSIPFYVYDDMAWASATFGNITVEALGRVPKRRKHFL
jgi:hypothetical protein